MKQSEIKQAKSCILKCLTKDFEYNDKQNQAIFDKKEGWACFNDTDLDMVMEKVVLGLYFCLRDNKP